MRIGRIVHFSAAITSLIIFFGIATGCHRKERQDAAGDQLRFTDVATAAGLKFDRLNGATGKKYLPETMGGGGRFIDYDNDGWPDIILLNGDYYPGSAPRKDLPKPQTLAVYHNNRNGTFTDVTAKVGLDIRLNAMGIAVGDYDNDGFEDLFITALGGSRLYHNVSDGHGGRKFVDVTHASGIRDQGWPTSAAWLDYDRDGRLDLFVCHYLQWSPATDAYCGTTFKAYCSPESYSGEASRLYHNDGHGHFTDVTRASGIYNSNSKGLGVSVCDVDDDGWPDLIIANDKTQNYLYRNNQRGGFEEIGIQAGIALSTSGASRAGMGIDASYYNRSNGIGLAITTFSLEGLAFYDIPSATPVQAIERAQQAGLLAPTYPLLGFGLVFADFDNDGWPDLFITNGHIESEIERIRLSDHFAQPNLVFQNQGNATFNDVSSSAGPAVTTPMVGRAVCRGDYDNDGKTDILLIPNVGPPRLLHNDSPDKNHWITIKLVGTKSNRSALGSKLTIHTGSTCQYAYSTGGASYLSCHDPRVHFGIGKYTKVDSLDVRWPNGNSETWNSLDADQFITLTEATSPRVERFVRH